MLKYGTRGQFCSQLYQCKCRVVLLASGKLFWIYACVSVEFIISISVLFLFCFPIFNRDSIISGHCITSSSGMGFARTRRRWPWHSWNPRMIHEDYLHYISPRDCHSVYQPLDQGNTLQVQVRGFSLF